MRYRAHRPDENSCLMLRSPYRSARAVGILAKGVAGAGTAYPLKEIEHLARRIPQKSAGTGVTSAVLNIVSTRAPIALVCTRASPAVPTARCIAVPELLERIRSHTGLTLEEIAHLMRASRGTVHNWKANEPISSGNGSRLRDLDHAVRRISGSDSDAKAVRAQLKSRVDGGLLLTRLSVCSLPPRAYMFEQARHRQ